MRAMLSIAVILAGASCPVAQGALLADINVTSQNNAEMTQPGFTGVVRTGTTGIVTDIGTLDVTFAAAPGSTTPMDRNRNAPLTSPNQPLARLMRDLMFSQATPHPMGAFDTTVAGLNAGTYLLTTYHHDAQVVHHTNDLEISVDGGATFTPAVQDAPISTGTDPAEIGRASAPFTIAAGQNLVFRLIGDGGQDVSPPGPTQLETAILSGFVIEPFTMFGDFDRVGGVTADDFFILSGNLGTHLEGNFVGHAGGDINLDGKVDLHDFNQFKASFPAAFAAATASVPEPSTMGAVALLAAGGGVALRRRRRHS